MKAERLPSDRLSNLPSNIIDSILCLLPIKDAARTSILSRNWRYNWLTIPKLEFHEGDFIVSDKERLSIVEGRFDSSASQRMKMGYGCKMFYTIFHILLVHRGPIDEFTLSMYADDTSVEIDQILLHLSKNYNSLKKVNLHLDLDQPNEYRVPLSIHSFHQLTDLYLVNCAFDHDPAKFNGFRSLASLDMFNVKTTTETLLHLISRSLLLKSVSLKLCQVESSSSIFDLFKSLHVVEHLTFEYGIIPCFFDGKVPREHPTSLVNLKYLCIEEMRFCDEYGLPFLLLMIKCSPNLEKIRLEIDQPHPDDIFESVFVDYSDIWLENLNELTIYYLNNMKPEMEFVKLILAKSPVMKKVAIVPDREVTKDEQLKMLKGLLRCPRASPMVDIIVD